MRFSELDLSEDLCKVVEELGYEVLTDIQARSIPHLLAGLDVIGQSKTGSGKTAAFALPILEKVDVERKGLQALVLCPTRELCAQVAREIRRLGRRKPGLHVVVLSGGQFIAPQLSALEKGAQIAVGTPGRLMDIVGRGRFDASKIRTVVLDEADRMLDMGFEEDMQAILAQLPKDRQTVLFSATFPPTIESLSRRYQRDPKTIRIDHTDDSAPPIDQKFCFVDTEERVYVTQKIIEALNPSSALVFCNLKIAAAEVSKQLKDAGLSADAIHGDLEQFDRDRVMAKFRNHSTRVLVATDVAARGIDIQGLDLVINFDTPAKPEVYVHRIGRTGRAGQNGLAISLLAQRERHKLDRISDQLKVDCQVSLLEEILKIKISQAPQISKTTNAKTTNAKTTKDGAVAPIAMSTICVFGGRKDKLRPGDILGALTGDAGGFTGSDIGKIEIHDRLTYVAVSTHIANAVIEALSRGQIKKRSFKVSLVK